MRVKRIRNTLENEKGQSLVEFALAVPMLLLLVFGIAEFGRAWMTQNILTGAAREAVRLAAVPAPGGGWNGSAAETRGNQILVSAGIATTVSVQNAASPFGDVTATVNYDFPVVLVGFIPGLNSSTLPLTSTTTMRREY
jgi:hypothetical protein